MVGKLSASHVNEVARELLHQEHANLSTSDSDCLYRIAGALTFAVRVFGETEYAVQWLKEPNEALGGAIPIRLLATVEGDENVRATLGAIEHCLPV